MQRFPGQGIAHVGFGVEARRVEFAPGDFEGGFGCFALRAVAAGGVGGRGSGFETVVVSEGVLVAAGGAGGGGRLGAGGGFE